MIRGATVCLPVIQPQDLIQEFYYNLRKLFNDLPCLVNSTTIEKAFLPRAANVARAAEKRRVRGSW
jgi:hypothetical protein